MNPAQNVPFSVASTFFVGPVVPNSEFSSTSNTTRPPTRSIAVPAVFEAGHSDEERGKISAVHFVRFPLPSEARRAFRTADVSLVVDHPNERARARLSDETKTALADEL